MSEIPDGKEQDKAPAAKKKSVNEQVIEAVLSAANKAALEVSAMGIPKDKVDAAVTACAKKRSDAIIAQAIAYAVKLAKAETFSARKLLDEIASRAGIKLVERKPRGPNKNKKGGQDG